MQIASPKFGTDQSNSWGCGRVSSWVILGHDIFIQNPENIHPINVADHSSMTDLVVPRNSNDEKQLERQKFYLGPNDTDGKSDTSQSMIMA